MARHPPPPPTLPDPRTPAASAAVPNVINPEALDELRQIAALDQDGVPGSAAASREFLHAVLRTYVTEGWQHLTRIHEALGRGDVAAVRRGVHSLRSSSAYVGAVHLSALCAQAEGLAAPDAQDRDGLPALLADIDREFRQVAEHLRAREPAAFPPDCSD